MQAVVSCVSSLFSDLEALFISVVGLGLGGYARGMCMGEGERSRGEKRKGWGRERDGKADERAEQALTDGHRRAASASFAP